MSDAAITELATDVYYELRNVGAMVDDAAVDACELLAIINRALDDVLLVLGTAHWSDRP